MAMDGTAMGKEVAEAILDKNASEEAKGVVECNMIKMCTAIVRHIQNNAVVKTAGNETAQTGTVS